MFKWDRGNDYLHELDGSLCVKRYFRVTEDRTNQFSGQHNLKKYPAQNLSRILESAIFLDETAIFFYKSQGFLTFEVLKSTAYQSWMQLIISWLMYDALEQSRNWDSKVKSSRRRKSREVKRAWQYSGEWNCRATCKLGFCWTICFRQSRGCWIDVLTSAFIQCANTFCHEEVVSWMHPPCWQSGKMNPFKLPGR